MIIEKLPRYIKDVSKIVKSNKLTLSKIEETEKLFMEDCFHKSLRYHQIKCKQDKYRYSITVLNLNIGFC